MKRILLLLVLAAVAITAVGFYRGWFTLVTSTTNDGKQNIGVTVDQDKIKADKTKLKEEAKDAKDKVVEKVR